MSLGFKSNPVTCYVYGNHQVSGLFIFNLLHIIYYYTIICKHFSTYQNFGSHLVFFCHNKIAKVLLAFCTIRQDLYSYTYVYCLVHSCLFVC